MNWMTIKDRIVTIWKPVGCIAIGLAVGWWLHAERLSLCQSQHAYFQQAITAGDSAISAKEHHISILKDDLTAAQKELKATQEALWMARAKNIDLSIPVKRVSDYEKKVSFDLGQVERVEAEPITVAQPVVVPKVEPITVEDAIARKSLVDQIKTTLWQTARVLNFAPKVRP